MLARPTVVLLLLLTINKNTVQASAPNVWQPYLASVETRWNVMGAWPLTGYGRGAQRPLIEMFNVDWPTVLKC